MATSQPARDNRALRFYSEVLGLERLNYGLWSPEDELTFENLKAAQQRYEDEIVALIPEGARRILDVGCGTGILSSRLHDAGFLVEGLSPSPAQEAAFRDRTAAPFHRTRFEEFVPEGQYDCLIMSESVQYVPMERVFPKVEECLVPGGHLIVVDYFLLPHASGILGKSGHPLDAFQSEASKHGFCLLVERDITDETVPTLDLATDLARRAEIGLDLATERLRERRPWTYRIGRWLLRKPVRKLTRQRPLIDSAAFRDNKCYMQFLLQRSA